MAPVEHVTHIGKLIEITLDKILHKLICRRASVLRRLRRFGIERPFPNSRWLFQAIAALGSLLRFMNRTSRFVF